MTLNSASGRLRVVVCVAYGVLDRFFVLAATIQPELAILGPTERSLDQGVARGSEPELVGGPG
jgi:hypothetical protein